MCNIYSSLLVHDYEDTNWDIVSQVIFEIIPEFKKQLEDIVEWE